LLDQNTYSLTNYDEFATIIKSYNKLKKEAEELYAKMPENTKDAFYQLVLHPITACANLNEMYLETAKNKYYLQQGNALAANAAAAEVKRLFDTDQQISDFYNTKLAGGKWNHMMDQTHIGYTSWQEPRSNKMPAVQTLNADSLKGDHAVPVKMDGAEQQKGAYKGYISLNAAAYSRAISSPVSSWVTIPDFGNTLSGVTPSTVTSPRVKPGTGTPHLEYDIEMPDTGKVTITSFITPALDFKNGDGLFYAISIDDESPQQINVAPKVDGREWAAAVSNNIRKMVSQHHLTVPGKHVIKYWMVDPGVVLEKIVIDAGGAKASYLGPPVTR
jgi:hypothetical protein